ncbi:MAG: hypothetical protein AAGK79_17300 [Pseudomonadota bacterium]
MKIKLLISRAGPAGAQNAGEIIDVDKPEAHRMIAAGQAELVRSVPKAEKAVKG